MNEYPNILQILKGTNEAFINLQKVLKISSTEIKESIESLKEDMSGLAKHYKLTYNEINKNIDILAEFGWVIPIDFTFAEIINLIRLNNEKEINDILLDYYTNSENKEFNNMTKKLLCDNSLSKWKPLLEECVKAFNQKMYIITIPSLLTVLEGMMANILKDITSTRMIGPCKDKYKEQKENSINKLLWHSHYKFIEKLYKQSNFDEPQPHILNRHWILHGRTPTDWDIVDSLRLFVAIETLENCLF